MTLHARVSSPSLYVHIPFCRSRCGYCSFVSGEYHEDTATAYIDAVLAEIQARDIFSQTCRPSTLFIGGGTPSMLSAVQLDALLSGLPKALGEATCEVNPDSITVEKLRILRSHGINRLSFGVQTFSPEGLRLLGRAHDASTARTMIEAAAAIGFTNISLDLINGWPGQDEDCLKNDIEISVSLPIRHVSCYNLILEPVCRDYDALSCLMSGHALDEERDKRFWDIIEQNLEKMGFIHYETSNYALPDNMCRHNVAIWRGGQYLGVGLAAHSHLSGRRFANTDSLDTYIQCSTDPSKIEEFDEVLTPLEKARECAVFWLRLFEGIDIREYAETTGYTLDRVYGDVLTRLLSEGLLEWSGDGAFLRAPKRYQPVLDSILVELV